MTVTSPAGRTALLSGLACLAGCASTHTDVLLPYELANGQILQDVVTVAADESGGASVITTVTTYEVSEPGQTVLVARDSASAPGPGLLFTGGFSRGIATSLGVIGAAVILDDEGGGDTFVNSSYSTSGNTATGGGNAGDIDAVSGAFGDCGADCSISN